MNPPLSAPADGLSPLSVENYRRPALAPPNRAGKLLLHSCCAPCSAEILDALAASKIETTIFFYNPNIHPRDEYEIRKREIVRYAEKLGVAFVDGDYDAGNWFDRTRGQEWEPERGARCATCFDMRFEAAADYAAAHGFDLIASTLGISRRKNIEQVNECGARAAARHPGMTYWSFNWRKQGGSQRMLEITKREGFYRQEYCGCVYSLRDTNAWRESRGQETIRRLVKSCDREDEAEAAEDDRGANPSGISKDR